MEMTELFSEDEQAGFHGTVYEEFASPETAPEPTYPEGKVFVGWSIGDSDMLKEILEKKLTDPNLDANAARRQAFFEFKNRVGEKRDPVFIDRSEPDVLFAAGKRGIGKSFLMRSLTNRSGKGGATNIISDPEHEFYSNNQYNGIQDDDKNLRDGENKQNIDTKVLMPYPVYKARKIGDMPEDGYNDEMEVFKFGFQDLNADDISYLISSVGVGDQDLKTLALQVQQELRENPDSINSFEDIVSLAREIEGSDDYSFSWPQFVQNFRTGIKPYQDWGMLAKSEKDRENYRIDLKEILNNYNNVAISLEAGEEMPSNLPIRQIYLSVIIRNVRQLAVNNEIDTPINYAIDEAHEIAPAGVDLDEHTAKKQIRQTIKKDRKRGMRVSMVTQNLGDIEFDNFIDQSRHFFIPHNLDPSAKKKLLDMAGVHKPNDTRREKWFHITEDVPEHTWLYVDEAKEEWYLLEVASPLAYHD